jgi:diguanylate cyclase (GGDEF)-like protein
MKRKWNRIFVFVLAGIAACAWGGGGGVLAARAAEPEALTSLSDLHALTNAQASQGLPAGFEATVTYYRDSDNDLFVQEGNTAIYVRFKPGAGLQAGDRVLIHGVTEASFRPVVVADRVVLLRHETLPEAIPASFEQLIRSQLDCVRIVAHAVVRSTAMRGAGPKRSIYLEALMDGGYVDVAVNSPEESALNGLLDAQVEITGIATAIFDKKMQMAGARIDVQNLSDVKILKPAVEAADSLPLSRLEDVLGAYHVEDLSKRVRVRGTITYYQPGSNLVLQDGSESLWITTMTSQPLRVGDIAEVSGFPDVRSGYLGLTHAAVTDTQQYAPIPPLPIHWKQLGLGGNAFNLVSIQARLVRQDREAATDQYVLDENGRLFSAIYRHPLPSVASGPPAQKLIPIGSMVRVTGIGMFYSTDSFNGPIASDILLQSLDGIVVTAPPSMLTNRNLMTAVGVLILIVFSVSLWGWFLERKVRRQTAVMADRSEAEAVLQGKRSQILEDINASRPLVEIVEGITQMVSCQLNGAPCWCEVADGAQLGDRPSVLSDLRIVQKEITGRTGPHLGTIFAALDQEAQPSAEEFGALAVGARLATLAIETQRLYSDLHRRSEYDLLTDVHNRFSLDRYLTACIAEAHQTASVFGLIYIDLDDFKKVNDLFGHQVGDLYLQQVTQRMKRQLRSADMLARLGGDEFVVLAPDVHNRAAVEEIALRLKRCFHDVFLLEGHTILGTASIGISVYPEDGMTQDSLFNAADAAMYRVKHAKQQLPFSAVAHVDGGSEGVF